MVTRSKVAAATVAVMAGILMAWPSPAQAQDDRLRITVGAATTTGGADSQPALTASIGYRFSQRLSFDIEGTGFELPDDAGPIRIASGGGAGLTQFDTRGGGIRGMQGGPAGFGIGGFPGITSFAQGISAAIFPPVETHTSGETIIATLGLRYEFPVQAGRLMPYVTAGLGAARTERTFSYSVQSLVVQPNVRGGATTLVSGSEKTTHTGLASSLGVGASLRVIGQLALDVDARYFRLDNDRSLGRLGGGLSFRF